MRLRVKDGIGAGNLFTANTLDNTTVKEDETWVGAPIDTPVDEITEQGKEQETYIGKETKTRTDMNKITSTKVGDDIHFYVNGKEDRGIVVKMNNSYITVAKENGTFSDVYINDTFFVKDILLNKTWNDMTPPEKSELLLKAHAPSQRFVTKTWEQLPKELQSVLLEQGAASRTEQITKGRRAMSWNRFDAGVRTEIARELGLPHTGDWDTHSKQDQKKLTANGYHNEPIGIKSQAIQDTTHFDSASDEGVRAAAQHKRRVAPSSPIASRKSDVEQGNYGSVGGSPETLVSTDTKIDVDDKYEGQTHQGERSEQFKYEERKPKVDQDSKKAESLTKDHFITDLEGSKRQTKEMKELGLTSIEYYKRQRDGTLPKGYGVELKNPYDKKSKAEQPMRGEFVYTETTKYKVKGVPEIACNTWGIKYETSTKEKTPSDIAARKKRQQAQGSTSAADYDKYQDVGNTYRDEDEER